MKQKTKFASLVCAEEAGELVVQTHSVSPKTVREGKFIIWSVRKSGVVAAVNAGRIFCKPVIQTFTTKTPVAVQRILEAEATDPAPTPVIASPIRFVIVRGIVIVAVIIVVNIPFPVGISATNGRIQKRPIIQERDTKTAAKRRHEIDLRAIGKAFLIILCVLPWYLVLTIEIVSL